jgi:hypothetical protein
MGLFTNFQRSRRRSKAWGQAYEFKKQGKLAEAAGVYERLAEDSFQYNLLIYGGDCHDAFKLWLEAKNIDNAMREARKALHALSEKSWLKMSTSAVDELSKMVGELYVSGYATAADTFAREINEQLVLNGLPPQLEIRRGKFPTTCAQCGGALPFTYSESSIPCPFCGAVVHAE